METLLIHDKALFNFIFIFVFGYFLLVVLVCTSLTIIVQSTFGLNLRQ